MPKGSYMKIFTILIFILLFQVSCKENIQFQSLTQTESTFNLSSSGVKAFTNPEESLEQEKFQLNNKKPLLDILVVADTSGSMYHRLNQLGQSLSALLAVISNYDWQIGITLADHGDHRTPQSIQKNWKDNISKNPGRFGSLMPLENGTHLLSTNILSPQTPNYEQVFLHSLSHRPKINCQRPPYCSNYLEQPLRSLQSALKRSVLDNRNFFRDQADFVSLIITNEEERQEDQSRATSASEVVNSFLQYFPKNNKKFIAYNIIVKDSSCLNIEKAKGGKAHIAHSIAKLAELTGGSNVNLCSQDYGSELRKISRHIKYQLENTVSLKKEPIPESLQVHFLEGPVLNWRLSGKSLIFENKASVSVKGLITYQARSSFL